MEQILSFLGVIAVWIGLSVAAWWLHRLYMHRKQRHRLALANEAWMRVREAPEIFADIRAAGAASGAADMQAATYALLNRVRDYSDYFDDVSALRAELARALGRDDCAPLTELLNIRRDIWAAADVLIIDDPAVFGDAFEEPGAYTAFCEEAEDLLFLDGPPLPEDPMVLRLQMADEDMQTFVSGVEGEIADERERERLPTAREIIAYPLAWARAVPRLFAAFWRGLGRLARFAARMVRVSGELGAGVARGLWAFVKPLPGMMTRLSRHIVSGVSRLPALAQRPGAAIARAGRAMAHAIAQIPAAIRASFSGVAGLRRHPLARQAAAAMRRASDTLPGQMSQGLARAADMARDARERARSASANARDRVRSFEAGELGLHYDFLIKAHGLRQRYADVLRRAPEMSETGRQFIARLELEKRSERLRLGTAKLRRRARLELVRILSVTIAALERLRDRLADAPAPAPQNAARLMSPLPRLFLPPPSAREAGAHFPGGLRAQARSWARGWSRPAQRMRNVTPEQEEADIEADDAASPSPEAAQAEPRKQESVRNPFRARSAGAKPRREASQDTMDDPARRAARRVRGLFGIRDRKPPRPGSQDAPDAPRKPASSANGADRAAPSAAGEEAQEHAEAGPAPDPSEPPPGNTAADAQILPPLRGASTGNYDSNEADAPRAASLRSRLSGLNGHNDEMIGEPSAQEAGNDTANDAGPAHRARQRGWRRWFGLRRDGG